jgi:uncharacterized DUF497 family protein
VDNRPVIWDATNLRHLELDHPEREITRIEVDQALDDPARLEESKLRENIRYYTAIGRTRRGRLLVVVWVDHPAGRFPVHARQAGRRAARRYYR